MNNFVFKESRKRLNLSQKTLADKIGLSLRMVQYLESGQQPVTLTVENSLRWIAYRDYALLLPVEYQDEIRFN